MHQFVQSAIEAAKQGDNNKAIQFLKQVLNANPNDVDAWLVLAAVMDDPKRKRQCLNRVLTLDPVNMVAREELMEMDRAEMGGTPLSAPEVVPASTSAYQPETSYYSSGASAFEPESVPQETSPAPAKIRPQTAPPTKASTKKEEKKLVFKYPLVWRILLYIFIGLFGCVGLAGLTQSLIGGLSILGFAVLILVVVLGTFPTVEVRNDGIRASGMFSSAETHWDEIVKLKSNGMKRRLELTKRNGEMVKVSTQVGGYPRIVEILQKRRPDLFGMTSSPQTQTSAFSSSYDNAPSAGYNNFNATPSFTGIKIFKKSFFKQHGLLFLIVPFCLFALWTAYSSPENRVGAILATVFCFIMIIIPFFQVSAVRVEPNKITIETLFEEKVLNAKGIRDIKMQTVRGRYGRATNFVNIIPVKGKNYPLQGFSDGDEIIYGVLINWWKANQGV